MSLKSCKANFKGKKKPEQETSQQYLQVLIYNKQYK